MLVNTQYGEGDEGAGEGEQHVGYMWQRSELSLSSDPSSQPEASPKHSLTHRNLTAELEHAH